MSLADSVKAREGAPFTASTAGAFPHEMMDEKMKGGENREVPALRGAGEWLLEERGGSSTSDPESRSRSVSTASRSRSSSVSSGSSHSLGRRGDRRNRDRRRSYYRGGYSSSSSSSRSRSRSRSRPLPRCHRAPARSRCCRGRRRSPPRRYRARSRSYSPSYSPVRRYRRRSPSRSRSRSRSRGRRVCGFVGRSRFRLTLSSERRSRPRSRPRSRSPERTSIHLSQQEKRQLLLVARENAAKALGVEDVALPASVDAVLRVQEEPTFVERVRPGASALNSLRENYEQADAEPEVRCPKMSPKNKITFSMNNSVAKPATGRSSSSPEKTAPVRVDSATGQNPYGHWVPVKARSFPLSASKRSPTKSR